MINTKMIKQIVDYVLEQKGPISMTCDEKLVAAIVHYSMATDYQLTQRNVKGCGSFAACFIITVTEQMAAGWLAANGGPANRSSRLGRLSESRGRGRPVVADRPEVARIFPTLPTAGPGADAWMNYIKHSFKGKEYRSHPQDDADFGVWSHVAFPSDGSKILKLPPRHLATAPADGGGASGSKMP